MRVQQGVTRHFLSWLPTLVPFTVLLHGQSTQPGTLQILPDFNSTHSISDVVHLGDNPNDSRFIPPQPSGATFIRTFELTSAQLDGTGAILLLLDQYQADNEILTQRSFVTLNGTFVNYLTRNSFIQDLTGATSIPVITESFSVRSLLRVGTNTIVVRAGDVHNPGDTFDDLCITNIRLTGLSTGNPACVPAAGRLPDVLIPIAPAGGISCPVRPGQPILGTGDKNNDGIPDHKIFEYPDTIGNTVEVWCLNDRAVNPSSNSSFMMYYNEPSGYSRWVGHCPYCGGFNNPARIQLGVVEGTTNKCIIGTHWKSTEGGNICKAGVNALGNCLDSNGDGKIDLQDYYGFSGYDCGGGLLGGGDGRILAHEYIFDARSHQLSDIEYPVNAPNQFTRNNTAPALPSTPEPPPPGGGPMAIPSVRGADVNGDGVVNTNDLKIFQNALGSSRGQPRYDPRADMDADGRVTLVDYQVWLRLSGQSGQ